MFKITNAQVFLQFGNAWNLDKSMNHWIDFGIHTDACMTRPDTCARAGGALSFWMKVIHCNYFGGLITSRHASTGFQMLCYGGKFT